MARIDARLASKARFSSGHLDGGAAARRRRLDRSLACRRRRSWAAGVARANNGIPGSLGVLLPLDKPQEIGLATTFGLILSDDGGTSWVWTCEQTATSMANVYTVGAPPADRFYALSLLTGLSFSDDESCGWRSAGGALAGQTVSDFFTDPSDPMRVLAAATPVTDGGGAALASVYASTDGGATFGATPLYTAPAGASIVGIEIARSDPQVIYLTYVTVTSTGYDPFLVRSTDGGAELDADRSAPPARLHHRPDPGRRQRQQPISSICGPAPRPRRRWR